jgi:asparagine synthase (glutamine-hydrolysing)
MKNSNNYNKYLNDWKNTFGKNVRNPYLKNPELYFENPHFRDHIYLNKNEFESLLIPDFSEPFYEEKYSKSLLRNRMLNELFHESIPVILHEDDLNSMLYSIENRSPYLDLNLFNISYSISNEYLIQEGYAKYILRESMKGILNEKVRNDWKKVGFNASINSLLDLRDDDIRKYLLRDWKIYKFVKKHKIEKIINKDPMPNSYSKFLFSFINSCLFLEKNEEN